LSPWTRRATTPSQTWIGVRSAMSARFVIGPPGWPARLLRRASAVARDEAAAPA
jgi:hypothetical protein